MSKDLVDTLVEQRGPIAQSAERLSAASERALRLKGGEGAKAILIYIGKDLQTGMTGGDRYLAVEKLAKFAAANGHPDLAQRLNRGEVNHADVWRCIPPALKRMGIVTIRGRNAYVPRITHATSA